MKQDKRGKFKTTSLGARTAQTAVLLLATGLTANADVNEQTESLPFDVPAGSSVVRDMRKHGFGCILLRDAQHRLTIVWVKDRNRYTPPEVGVANLIEPQDAHRAGPFEGSLIHFQQLVVPAHRLPSSVFDPMPTPGPDGWTEEQRGEIRRRVDLDDRETERVFLVTQEGIHLDRHIRIRLFDGNGHLMHEHRKDGQFDRHIHNKDTGEISFLVQKDGLLHWIVIDIKQASAIADSRFGLPPDREIVAIEPLGIASLVIIEKWRDRGIISVRPFRTDGQPLHALDIPGRYVGSVDNGGDLMALVFQSNGTVHLDFIQIHAEMGAVTLPEQVRHGIVGEHKRILYSRVRGEDRFVEALYDSGRDETTVRMLNGLAQVIANHVRPGKFNDRCHRAPDHLTFAIERGRFTDLVVVSMVDGQQKHLQEFPTAVSRFSITVSQSGVGMLVTNQGTSMFRAH